MPGWNEPDDIRMYDHDPRSPYYEGPEEDEDEEQEDEPLTDEEMKDQAYAYLEDELDPEWEDIRLNEDASKAEVVVLDAEGEETYYIVHLDSMGYPESREGPNRVRSIQE